MGMFFSGQGSGGVWVVALEEGVPDAPLRLRLRHVTCLSSTSLDFHFAAGWSQSKKMALAHREALESYT